MVDYQCLGCEDLCLLRSPTPPNYCPNYDFKLSLWLSSYNKSMIRRESLLCAARIVELLRQCGGRDLQQKEITAALIDQHYPTTIIRTLKYLTESECGLIEKKTIARIKGERGKPPVFYKLKEVKG